MAVSLIALAMFAFGWLWPLLRSFWLRIRCSVRRRNFRAACPRIHVFAFDQMALSALRDNLRNAAIGSVIVRLYLLRSVSHAHRHLMRIATNDHVVLLTTRTARGHIVQDRTGAGWSPVLQRSSWLGGTRGRPNVWIYLAEAQQSDVDAIKCIVGPTLHVIAALPPLLQTITSWPSLRVDESDIDELWADLWPRMTQSKWHSRTVADFLIDRASLIAFTAGHLNRTLPIADHAKTFKCPLANDDLDNECVRLDVVV